MPPDRLRDRRRDRRRSASSGRCRRASAARRRRRGRTRARGSRRTSPRRASSPPRGSALGERGEHRLVASRRGAGVAGSSRLPEQEPVLLLAVEVGGHERPDALEPLPVQPDGQAAVALLLEQLVGAADPRSRPCPRRTGPSGSRPRTSRTSSGWSSTCTASALVPSSSGTPFGTAHEASTPSRSSRKS